MGNKNENGNVSFPEIVLSNHFTTCIVNTESVLSIVSMVGTVSMVNIISMVS